MGVVLPKFWNVENCLSVVLMFEVNLVDIKSLAPVFFLWISKYVMLLFCASTADEQSLMTV